MPLEPVRGEHLVPVVADPAAGPAVAAAAGQTHRVGVGRSEERLGGGGAPVDQQPTAGAVGEAESPDVDRLGVVRADDATEAQVQPEPAQRAQPSGQPVDLQVPLQGLLATAAGRHALGVESVGQVGDRLLEALAMAAKCCSSPAIRVGSALAARWAGRSNALVVTVVTSSCSDLRRSGLGRRFCGHDGGLAASPPVRYTLRVEGSRTPFLSLSGRSDRPGPRWFVMMAGMTASPLARVPRAALAVTVCACLAAVLAGCSSPAPEPPAAMTASPTAAPTGPPATAARARPPRRRPPRRCPPRHPRRRPRRRSSRGVQWVRGSGGRSLHIVPTASGRSAQGAADDDEAWSEVLRLGAGRRPARHARAVRLSLDLRPARPARQAVMEHRTVASGRQ